MSVETTVAILGTDVKTFFTKLKADVSKAKAVWNIISSQQVRALMIQLTNQAITTVKDAASAAESGGLNLTLDTATVTDIKTLIADVQAGEPILAADFKAIGVIL